MTNRRPHIVFLCLDAVRKDTYNKVSERLDGIVDVEYEQMRTLSSWSAPSHAGILTGDLPSETGVHAYSRDMNMLQKSVWTTMLRNLGYSTVGISANIYASPSFGFDQFFDSFYRTNDVAYRDAVNPAEFIENRETRGIRSYLQFLKKAAQSESLTKSIINGIKSKYDGSFTGSRFNRPHDFGGREATELITHTISKASEPTFIFANLMDAHGPHEEFRGIDADVPSGFNRRGMATDYMGKTHSSSTPGEIEKEYDDYLSNLRKVYDKSVAYLCRLIEQMSERLRNKCERDVAMIVTADHGENFGRKADEYLLAHSSSLSEGLVHVPFDVIYPKWDQKTVTGLTSHASIRPIIEALAKDNECPDITTDVAYSEILGCGGSVPNQDSEGYWNRTQRSVVTQQTNGRLKKHVRDDQGVERVFRVDNRPSSQIQIDCSPQNKDMVEHLFDEFEDWPTNLSERDESQELDKRVKNQLEKLGYR